MPAVAEQAGMESKHGLCAMARPAHTGLFECRAVLVFAGQSDSADGVAHAASIFPQAGDVLNDGWAQS